MSLALAKRGFNIQGGIHIEIHLESVTPTYL
jgi:hypothetical protein